MNSLLGFANAKTVKGEGDGYLTAIMYLAPYKTSGTNLCPKASKGCAAACLYTAGRGAFKSIQKARLNKTKAFLDDTPGFIARLVSDIGKAKRKAERKGLKLCVRLNGTSDILWERYGIFEQFPDVQFYDYTAIAKRFTKPLPPNYHLTFSLKEDNDADAYEALKHGGNVAAVFKGPLPTHYFGYPVIDGDKTDLRFLDPRQCIIGLKAKGKAKQDTTGFVRDTAMPLELKFAA